MRQPPGVVDGSPVAGGVARLLGAQVRLTTYFGATVRHRINGRGVMAPVDRLGPKPGGTGGERPNVARRLMMTMCYTQVNGDPLRACGGEPDYRCDHHHPLCRRLTGSRGRHATPPPGFRAGRARAVTTLSRRRLNRLHPAFTVPVLEVNPDLRLTTAVVRALGIVGRTATAVCPQQPAIIPCSFAGNAGITRWHCMRSRTRSAALDL